jgi:REP element-mobilizing transposase RayT
MAYQIRNQQGTYFITCTVVRWIDIFSRKEYKDIVIDSLRYCQQKKGLELIAFCLMTNHLHLIVRAADGASLSAIMRDFKKYTASRIVELLYMHPQESRREWLIWLFGSEGEQNPNNERFQMWQHRSHAVELTSAEMALQRLRYLHENPVRAGICYCPEDYIYSSAAEYAGRETVLPVSWLLS